MERLEAGEMPPPDAFVPPGDLEAFLNSLNGPGLQCSDLGEVCDASSPCCDSLHSCLGGVCAPGCLQRDDSMCADPGDG